MKAFESHRPTDAKQLAKAIDLEDTGFPARNKLVLEERNICLITSHYVEKLGIKFILSSFSGDSELMGIANISMLCNSLMNLFALLIEWKVWNK